VTPAMKSPFTVLRPALFCAAAPVCLILSACDPVDDPNAKKDTWRPRLEIEQRTVRTDPASEQWLAAWRDLRTRLAPLESRLAELQKLHADSHFDNILAIDVNTLNAEQLGSLQHFLQRGYFTLERRVLIHLLERRFDRTDPMLAVNTGDLRPLKDRLATAMHRDEIRMMDLETAIRFYQENGEENFQVPTFLSEEKTAELRVLVGQLLDKARAEVGRMDWKIAVLQAKAFPGQYPEPPPEPPADPPPTVITPPATATPEESAPAETGDGMLFPEESVPPADASAPDGAPGGEEAMVEDAAPESEGPQEEPLEAEPQEELGEQQ